MSELPVSGWFAWALFFAMFRQAFQPWVGAARANLSTGIRIAMTCAFYLIVPAGLWTAFKAWSTFGTGHLIKASLVWWIGGLVVSFVYDVGFMLFARSSSTDAAEREIRRYRVRYTASMVALVALFPSWWLVANLYRQRG